MRKPVISVVVVSDYGSSASKTWDDERRCLAALAAQDIGEPFEVLLLESSRFQNKVPPDVAGIVPGARVVFSDAETSYGLKNAGAREASAHLVAILDADCSASPDWLRHCVAVFRKRPEVSVVSGRTHYEGSGLLERVLCLLSRSYQDPGREGETGFASNNATGFRRDAYLANPLPENLGPFSARIQSEAIRRAGGVLWFEPKMRVVHEFEGVAMEMDIRRNIGYGTVATRLAESWMPYASLIRRGVSAIPLIYAGKLFNAWGDCIRCAKYYGVRPYELPVALVSALVVQAMEVPGMFAAYRGRSVGPTAYR